MAITMKYLREYGFTTEGIFRVPGDTIVIENYQRLFDNGACEIDFRGCSVHDVAALLKLYIRKLPKSLIPSEFYDILLQLQIQYEENSKNEKDFHFQLADKVLSKLSACERHVLQKLVIFLRDLSKHEKQTKMNIDNLALIFAPNIIRPKEYTVDSAMQTPTITKILHYFIENWDSLIEQSIEIDPLVAVQYDLDDNVKSNLKNLQNVQRQANLRYSMDAFDPLLCNEIPLPETLNSSKGKLRVVPKSKKAKKVAKRRFSRKLSPRRDETNISDSPLSNLISDRSTIFDHENDDIHDQMDDNSPDDDDDAHENDDITPRSNNSDLNNSYSSSLENSILKPASLTSSLEHLPLSSVSTMSSPRNTSALSDRPSKRSPRRSSSSKRSPKEMRREKSTTSTTPRSVTRSSRSRSRSRSKSKPNSKSSDGHDNNGVTTPRRKQQKSEKSNSDIPRIAVDSLTSPKRRKEKISPKGEQESDTSILVQNEPAGIVLRNEKARRKRRKAYKMKYSKDIDSPEATRSLDLRTATSHS